MKKYLLLCGILLSLGVTSYGKEMVTAPAVEKEPEVMAVVEELEPHMDEVAMVENKWVMEFRGGVDVASEYKDIDLGDGYSYSGDTKKVGYEVGLEISRNINPAWNLGMGVMYQGHADRKHDRLGVGLRDARGGEFDSIPLYVTTRYVLMETSNEIKLYGKANLGYSFNINEKNFVTQEDGGNEVSWDTKIKNGLYWGAGLGLEYKDWTMDVMYQVNTGKATTNSDGEESQKEKVDYSRVSVGLGYRFNY